MCLGPGAKARAPYPVSPCLDLVKNRRKDLLRVVQFQRESDDSQVRQLRSQGIQLYRIFLRRQEAVGPGAAGLAAKPLDIGFGVGMMIAKRVMTGGLDAGAFKIAQKALRSGNRAKYEWFRWRLRGKLKPPAPSRPVSTK